MWTFTRKVLQAETLRTQPELMLNFGFDRMAGQEQV